MSLLLLLVGAGSAAEETSGSQVGASSITGWRPSVRSNRPDVTGYRPSVRSNPPDVSGWRPGVRRE